MLSYLRFLYRNKLYTLVNVLGFAVSLMFVILIADYAWRQNSTDSWNKNKDRIFLLGTHSSFIHGLRSPVVWRSRSRR